VSAGVSAAELAFSGAQEATMTAKCEAMSDSSVRVEAETTAEKASAYHGSATAMDTDWERMEAKARTQE
jgi:hypothetical protein